MPGKNAALRCPLFAVVARLAAPGCDAKELLDSEAAYRCPMWFTVPAAADDAERIGAMAAFSLRWVAINAPVLVVCMTALFWTCGWSVVRSALALATYVICSLLYYIVHRAMHQDYRSPLLMPVQWLATVHRRVHHGGKAVFDGNTRAGRAANKAVEWAFELLTSGLAYALLPFLPRLIRAFAAVFAFFSFVMHNVSCHAMHTRFHDVHHERPGTNFMPAYWDSVFGTLAQGPDKMQVVDENHTWWIGLVLLVIVKLSGVAAPVGP